MLTKYPILSVTDPEIAKSGGGRQRISLVVMRNKCTQCTICLLYGKDGLLQKILSQWGGGRPTAPPPALNPPLNLVGRVLMRFVDTFRKWLTFLGGPPCGREIAAPPLQTQTQQQLDKAWRYGAVLPISCIGHCMRHLTALYKALYTITTG